MLQIRCRRRRVGACFVLVFRGLDDAGDGEQLVALGEVDEFHPFCAAARLANLTHARAHALALGGEEHDLVVVADAERAGELDGAVLGQVDGPHSGAAAVDQAVVFEAGADAKAGLARNEELRLMVDDLDDVEVVARELEAHAGDAAGGAAGGAEQILTGLGIVLAEAHGEALVGNEDELVVAGGQHRSDEPRRPRRG